MEREKKGAGGGAGGTRERASKQAVSADRQTQTERESERERERERNLVLGSIVEAVLQGPVRQGVALGHACVCECVCVCVCVRERERERERDRSCLSNFSRPLIFILISFTAADGGVLIQVNVGTLVALPPCATVDHHTCQLLFT
jgi:hypothetical protein